MTTKDRLAALFAAAVLSLSGAAAVGCGDDDKNSGPAEDAGKELDEAGKDAGEELDEAGDDAEREIHDATKEDKEDRE